MWQAVKDKDYGRVEQLMDSEYNPDEYNLSHGGTPLHQSTWDGERVSASLGEGGGVTTRVAVCPSAITHA